MSVLQDHMFVQGSKQTLFGELTCLLSTGQLQQLLHVLFHPLIICLSTMIFIEVLKNQLSFLFSCSFPPSCGTKQLFPLVLAIFVIPSHVSVNFSSTILLFHFYSFSVYCLYEILKYVIIPSCFCQNLHLQYNELH